MKTIIFVVALLYCFSALATPVAISATSQAWADEQQVIKVGLLKSVQPPFYFSAQLSEVNGIYPLLLNQLLQPLHLSLKYYLFDNEIELNNALQKQQIDLLVQRKKAQPEHTSHAFLTTKQSLLTANNAVHAFNEKQKIFSIDHFFLDHYQLRKESYNSETILVDNISEAAITLKYAMSHAYISDQLSVRYWLTNNKKSKLKQFVLNTFSDVNFYFISNETMLIKELNKRIKSTTKENQQALINNWLDNNGRKPAHNKQALAAVQDKTNPNTSHTSLLWAGLFSVAFILLLLLFQQVRLLKKKLKKQRDKIQSIQKTQTEFVDNLPATIVFFHMEENREIVFTKVSKAISHIIPYSAAQVLSTPALFLDLIPMSEIKELNRSLQISKQNHAPLDISFHIVLDEQVVPLKLLAHSINLGAETYWTALLFKVESEVKTAKLATIDNHILVAEDHPTNQEIIRCQLNALGYQCDMADNGKQALQMLEKRDYPLLISDCHMPEMDGFQLTEKIRLTNTKMPILALTGEDSEQQMSHCLSVGMNDCLAKPSSVEALKEKLDKHLPLKEIIEEKAEVVASVEALINLQHAPVENDSQALQFDDQQLSELLSINQEKDVSFESPLSFSELALMFGDEKTTLYIINEFLESHQENTSELIAYQQKNDFENIAITAHRMKGAASMITATALSELCAKIEVDANKQHSDNLAVQLTQIQEQTQLIKDYLATFEQ